MVKELRARLRLPTAEVLHMVHVVGQTIKGAMLGLPKAAGWKEKHIFCARGEDGQPLTVHAFIRVEFQDGTRKAPTQDYHGSGRPHFHALFFASPEALAQMDLPDKILATEPTAEPGDVLSGAVVGSQLDRSGASRRPRREEPSVWDAETGQPKLRHTAADKKKGLRAYFVDVMDGLRCHQDLQMGDGRAALRAYVAKYAAKFSDASQEWLNDAAEANSVAATVLCRYRPRDLEVALAAGQRGHEPLTTSGPKHLQDHLRLVGLQPREVGHYLRADWARGKISLLDFLRKTNADGKISAWLKKAHAELPEDGRPTLEAHAARHECRGEKLVAADTLSRLGDKFYGQWLMLHVPFESPRDFLSPIAERLARVPEERRNFAAAMLCEHEVARRAWGSEAAMREELQLEAITPAFADTILGFVAANKQLLQKYLTGEASAAEEAAARQAGQATGAGGPAAGSGDLNREQRRLKQSVDEAVERSLAAQAAATEAEADLIVREARERGKVFVCSGPPGTGKTTAALACVEGALEKGGQVLFAYPTNRQASRMRARMSADVAVDTYHAAFGLDLEPGACVAGLAQYALIVVDEFSQLQKAHFEHIVKLWQMADNLPALLLAGDPQQIAGYGEERAWHSPLWKRAARHIRLHETYRCKDPVFNKILQELRTSRPCAATLKTLQKMKAWAPPQKPDANGIRRLLKAHPETTVLCCSRAGAQRVNDLALEGLYPSGCPLAVVSGDVESNPANYQDGKLKADFEEGDFTQLRSIELPIYKGMRVVFTRNVRKDIDYVSGMDGHVVEVHAESKAVEVLTSTGHRVMAWPWSDVELGGMVYHPLKAGYADTILKFQGAELAHVTAYLDTPKVPGAGYTALRQGRASGRDPHSGAL